MEEKRPRLFYWEESHEAWVPAPDNVENIIDVSSFLKNDDEIEIQFKRRDMTDAEYNVLFEK